MTSLADHLSPDQRAILASIPGVSLPTDHDRAVVTTTYWNHRCRHDCPTWVPNHLRHCRKHQTEAQPA